MTNSHGILMSGEMIRAYKHGLKTETRRTRGLDEINQAPDEWQFSRFIGYGKQKRPFVLDPEGARFVNKSKNIFVDVRLPYGSPGSSLWFRETWKMWEREEDGRDFLHYRADDEKVDPIWWVENDWTRPDPVWHKTHVFEKWQPSMFMPKLCCRFRSVQVLNVRVERLCTISHTDAVNEGMPIELIDKENPREWYFQLWDKLNGKTFPVASNPWLFVYEFPKYEINEAGLLHEANENELVKV